MRNHIAVFVSVLFFCAACGEKKKPVEQQTSPAEVKAVETPADITVLLEKYTCATCHKANDKLIGPAYKEIAERNYPAEEIVNLIYNPKPQNWPDYPPMIGLKDVPKEDALKIAQWINSLKK